MKPFLITIARQYGSGGKTIGRMLAAELGIPCYDREIITLASEDSGINARLFSDERLKPDFWQRIRGGRPGTVVPPESAGFVSNDNLFEYQARIIRRLADEGPCIIIGRCADYVLRQREDLVRLFIYADGDFCLKEAMKINSLPQQEVERLIAKTDEYRAKYYRYYTGQEWKNAMNYDLCLNTRRLGFEGAARAVKAYLAIRFGETED